MSEEQQDNAENTSAETQNTENRVPQSRFNQVVGEKKALEERLAKLEAAQREKEEKLLAEQGEYKTLYEQALAEVAPLKEAKEKLAQLEADLEQRNKDRLALIPEDKRSLIPELDDPVKLGKWLDRNLSLITEQAKPTAPRGDGGARGNITPTPYKLTAQELEFAKLAGMSPERYAEQKAKRGEAVDIESLRKKE